MTFHSERPRSRRRNVPRSLQERFLKVNQAVEELSGRLGRSPSPQDVAKHTGLTLEEVLEALEASSAYSLRDLLDRIGIAVVLEQVEHGVFNRAVQARPVAGLGDHLG